MRVVVLTNILTPYRIPLFAELARRVDDFTVLLMSENEENRTWQLSAPGFKTVVLPGKHIRPPGYEVSLHINYGVMRILREMNPDVVVSGGFAPANMVAAVYCRLFKKKYVGWGEISTRDRTARSRIRSLLRRFIISGSAGCIASSSEARGAFISYGCVPERALLAPMAIDVSHFHDGARDFRGTPGFAALRQKYTGPILLSVGRMIDAKGYLELFEIYCHVLAAQPTASLLLIGDGPERQKFERVVIEMQLPNVHFIGFVQGTELPKYYAIADVFVFHTLADTFGAVLTEAMAAELPAVSSIHAAATHDFVVDGVTGLRIDPKKIKESAEAVLKILGMTADQRAAMVDAAYRQVKRADIDTSARNMIEFMQRLLELNPVPRTSNDHGR